ncbi:unnamed protein product [marine sediment metagenome]|uniref:Uncharacterized protein n=1 Tax=marine sediment metagenome TaxID=412755 RepID=X1HEQ9_9ZZZZ
MDWGFALKVAITGFGLVFLALVLLGIATSLTRFILNKLGL